MLPQRAIESLRDYITSRDGFTVIAHISPDGDALGSTLALLGPYMGFCPWQISCAPQSRRWGIPM